MYICSLIEEFCASIKSSYKFSKNSFIAYSNDLIQFNDFLRANCSIQHFEDITADHISDYKDFLLNEVRYNSLARANPERAEALFDKAQEAAAEKYARLAAMAE